MSLWKIAWRSIQQRALASTLTAISMGLGVALVVAILVVRGTIGDSFRNNTSLGYNLIVGAKGGKLQLVLNTVYYLSSPVENIPYSYYKQFTEGKYKPYVAKAVPCCLGDYYQNYRVIGTTPEMFSFELSRGRTYSCSAGEIFKPDDYFGAVIGATVARETGLKVGADFRPTHGAPGGQDAHEHDPFRVVGVLKPTGTPNDRALFINIEGFYLLDNHAKPVEEETAGHAESGHHTASTGAHHHDDDDHAEHEHAGADHDHAGEGVHEHAEHEHSDDDHADDGHAEHEHVDHDHVDHDHMDDDHDHEHAEHADADHEHAEHAGHDHESAEAGLDQAHGAHAHEHAHEHEHEHGHEHAHEHGHHHHHEPLPESQREVTAVLLLTASPPGVPPELTAIDLVKQINKGNVAQAVLPIREVVSLFELFVGPIEMLLLALTVMIVVVAGIGILVSMYNSMSERRHEIAVMRALGAGRGTVMLIVLLESILLSLGGGLLGWLLGHLLIAGLNPWVVAQTGVAIGFFQSVPLELVIIPGLIALAAIVGYLPAMVAYRTDVAKALVAAP
jgi:ABC-type lipoprotein release transport system permease subunit